MNDEELAKFRGELLYFQLSDIFQMIEKLEKRDRRESRPSSTTTIKEKRMNYKLLTGCFEGKIVEEGKEILDVPFTALDMDLQTRIKIHANLEEREESSEVLERAKQDYEESWETEETEEEADLLPISEW